MEFSYNLFRDFERLWNFDSLVCDLIGYADQRARATDQQVEGTKRQVEDIEHPVENCSPGHEITHGMLVEFSTAMALHMIGVQNCYRSGQFKSLARQRKLRLFCGFTGQDTQVLLCQA
ncbi:hypothetical protein M7I_1427 [Glarea lozoyensis 74030]|uniref:Uncharacterized protein n=1 Tax=Glarea lozoyensis (strain ATCC 74030 / MF5533) TaxID=1104152 RepID=H0EG19_GLAL7|nr:hypothetical protein M7I_1427 [Glarea lozoyensis 74030]